VIRETPFHPRVAALNETGLWSHWAGTLVAEKYQTSEKFEYFAVRNSAGIFDTSPLYKYRIDGADAERFLAGVMARDIRKCRPGHAQYTMWCDDTGHVIEDGVVFRLSPDEYLLTAAGPNLAYLRDLAGGLQVDVDDVSDDFAALAIQGPRARTILARLAPEIEKLGYFGLTSAKIADSPVIVSRTGYTGDLGYEVWIERDHALAVWDAVLEVGAGWGVVPFGQIALVMTRIEAGLILIDVDFHSARYAWNDDQRDSPIELGYGWMFRDLASDDRAFIGRRAIEREIADGTSRWKLVGIEVDWQSWDRLYNSRHLVPPKDHVPEQGGMMLYDDEVKRAGYASSFMYSPLLQRHIGISKVRPELAEPGTKVQLEVTIDHSYDLVDALVTRLPFYNPPRKTA
jgi:aminomethyltransferase